MENSFFTDNASSVVRSNRILYTPSSFARSSLLYLQEIGELTAQQPHVSRRIGLASCLFFLVVDGAGSLNCGGKTYELRQGDMAFIDCEQPYSHMTDANALWTLRWIHFYGPQIRSIYEKYLQRGGRPAFRPDDPTPFHGIWETLMQLASGSDYIRDMKINASLNQLMVEIMKESWHPEEREDLPKKKRLIIPVKDYLDRNYTEKITLDDLAGKFYINKYYMIKVFKEQYGQSIHTYLLNLRITRAKQLLRFSEKTIEEIGEECGLGAAHYFSSRFREVEGVPPSKYREQW